MTALLSDTWYRHQAVLLALSINERLSEKSPGVDPIWGTILFAGLLGLDGDGQTGQKLAIDPGGYSKSVRRRLANLAQRSAIPQWSSAKFRRNGADVGTRTAKLIATLLYDRAVPPRTIWRTATDELAPARLPATQDVEDALSRLASSLRQFKMRKEKLKAIGRFLQEVPGLSAAWPALEPALVQPMLDWIPVSLGEGGAGPRSGVMVPVLVDLQSNHGEDRVEITGTPRQDTTALEYSADWALFCTCALWRNRYSNAPDRRLGEVGQAKLVLDLQLLEGIVQACNRAGANLLEIDAQLHLDGRSLELPLGLAIYGRLTGTRAVGQFRASGAFARFREDPQDPLSGETWLGPVNEIDAKALAAEQQLADRFIVSQGSQCPSTSVATVLVRSLGAAVDYAFGSNGDGHRFVRCADLAEAFKEEPYPVPTVEAFKNVLRSGPAVHQTDQPLHLIMQSLYDVNRWLGRLRYTSRGRYTFVRLSSTERADAAWASIWSALDGDPAEFDAFCKAPSFKQKAAIFAQQMSRAQASMRDPRWSPHVLILAGVEQKWAAGGLKGGATGRFDICRIMEAADEILGRSPSPCDPWLKQLIGATRVILAADDGMGDIGEGLPSDLPVDLQQAAIRLSVFRHGFTFDMARRQLGTCNKPMKPGDCQEILAQLRDYVCDDGKSLLVIGNSNRHRCKEAPTAFEYMLRRRRCSKDPAVLIEDHENAAHAIVPMLHQSRDEACLGVGLGLSAPWVDEAYYQLSQARQIAWQEGRCADKSRIQGLRLRLLRMSGWFLLERMPAMMGQNGHEVVYWDFAERLKPWDHPALHARAAAFATDLASHQPHEAERRRFFARAIDHLDQGSTAAANFEDPHEKRGSLFLIASERCRLAHVGRCEIDAVLAPEHRDLRKSAEIAQKHLPFMREIYWREFFSVVGDLIEDPRVAHEVYLAGLWNKNLPGLTDPDDDALIGWAGTLESIDVIPPDLLASVHQHLARQFFQRRKTVEAQERRDGIIPTERQLCGMKQLFAIRDMNAQLRSAARRKADHRARRPAQSRPAAPLPVNNRAHP